jgi:hypothetical protein
MQKQQYPPFNRDVIDNIKTDLDHLDRESIFIDGIYLKPSQCYHFDIDPVHILFNTNCPESVREKVQAILSKHIPVDETSAQQ